MLLLLFSALWAQNQQDVLSQKISTSFVKTPLERVVRVLAQQYNLNIIYSGPAKGLVTTNLNDIPLGEALDAILKSQGFHYVKGDNLLIVKPYGKDMNGELVSRVFHLKYVDGFHIKKSIEPLLSKKGKIEPLLSEPEKDDKFNRAEFIVVNDFWENVNKVAKVIATMDRPAKQLQIEVRLIEKVMGNSKRVGLDLPKSVTVQTTGAETSAPISKTNSQGSGGSSLLSAWYELPNNIQNLNLGVLTFSKLRATLDLLAEDANSHLLAKPSITAMDNKQAIIKMGTTIPVPEISRGISGDLLSYKEKDVNMTLEVIPHIGDNGDITLQVHPILEEIIGYTGSGEAPQPITSRREVKTTVILKDGETLVIGGLIKENKTENISKVWLLGDIPLLGYLFRHTNIKKEKSDLLIFITTKIFNAAKANGIK